MSQISAKYATQSVTNLSSLCDKKLDILQPLGNIELGYMRVWGTSLYNQPPA